MINMMLSIDDGQHRANYQALYPRKACHDIGYQQGGSFDARIEASSYRCLFQVASCD